MSGANLQCQWAGVSEAVGGVPAAVSGGVRGALRTSPAAGASRGRRLAAAACVQGNGNVTSGLV